MALDTRIKAIAKVDAKRWDCNASAILRVYTKVDPKKLAGTPAISGCSSAVPRTHLVASIRERA